ncbi:YaiI/YqxD family protein [Heyndrickxia sporothermodurans]|uniref:YaiI/YqxD family protein n=1 Tax=Heyndrickxia sporothermodurans TaxID=46224 RepID=UPI003D1C5BAB
MVTNTERKGTTIFVDADACPVKQEIISVAIKYSLPYLFIASYAHKSNKHDERWIYVDPDKESADLYIMNHVKKNDIVITQDIGLASLVLPKRVFALSPRGKEYKEEAIQTALDFRYLAAKARRRGKYEKGPKPFTEHDRQSFINKLEEILSNIVVK